MLFREIEEVIQVFLHFADNSKYDSIILIKIDCKRSDLLLIKLLQNVRRFIYQEMNW